MQIATDTRSSMTHKTVTALLAWVAICVGAQALGWLFTSRSVGDWYLTLAKPEWTPPAWLFGPVWTGLYLSMAVAAWLVWRRRSRVHARPALTLFGVQLLLSVAWSAVFFTLQRPDVAVIEITVLWAAILATSIFFRRISSLAAWLLAPYLIWVTFAAVLNLAIDRMNP